MAKLLSPEEIQKLLSKLPSDVKLDLVQFGLDLCGLVNPIADAASAAISFWRGDLLGGLISTVSIFPLGDILKIGKLGKYAATFEKLVLKVLPTNPALYKELEPVMIQFRSLLAKMPDGNASVETIRKMVNQYFKDAELLRLTKGMRTLEHLARVAKKRGRWKPGAYAKGGTTPEKFVDMLMNAAEHGGHPSLRQNAKEMVKKLGQHNWELAAGPHKTTKTAGAILDGTPHITVDVAGHPYSFHARLDNQGHIWEIRTVSRVDGKIKGTNIVPGTDRPWKGPGQ